MTGTPIQAAQGVEPQEFIAFHVGEQTYCIDIITVREIRGWTPATPLPHAPSFVRGVINLRGSVLPVVDLAARLGLPIKEPTPVTPSSSFRATDKSWDCSWKPSPIS